MQYLRQKSHWTLSFVFLVPILENTWPYSTAGVLRLILHVLLMYRKLQVSVCVCARALARTRICVVRNGKRVGLETEIQTKIMVSAGLASKINHLS